MGNGNNSSSPNLTPPVSQPASPKLPPWLDPNWPKPLQLGVLCETPNGYIELPWLRLGTHLEDQLFALCHKKTLDYMATHRLDHLNFTLPPNLLVRSIINYDGFTYPTPAILHLRKWNAGAILSVKPALPIGNSSLTGAGVRFGYDFSPRINIGLDAAVGKKSTDSYGQPIKTQTDLGLHLFIEGRF